MLRYLPAATLLGGCASGPTADAHPFEACIVGGIDEDPKDYHALRELSLSGTVVDSGNGVPSGCERMVWSAGARREAGQGWWIEIDDGAQPVRVGIWLAEGPAAPALDAEVSLTARTGFGGDGPSTGQVTLREATESNTLWMAMAGTVDALPGAPIALEPGEQVGRDGSDCGRWAYHDLIVGAEVVPYGSSREIDGRTVWHGGIEQQTGTTRCPDWFVAQAAVAVH
jgi:hypothetical protein